MPSPNGASWSSPGQRPGKRGRPPTPEAPNGRAKRRSLLPSTEQNLAKLLVYGPLLRVYSECQCEGAAEALGHAQRTSSTRAFQLFFSAALQCLGGALVF